MKTIAQRVVLDSPVLTEKLFKQILKLGDNNSEYKSYRISLNYQPEIGLEKAIDNICAEAEDAVRNGSVVLVLSDRDISKETLPVHALLATGAVHQHPDQSWFTL